MAEETDTALPMGLLAILGSPAHQAYRIQVQTHGGTRSDARLSDGTVTLSVSGASDVGRRGESAALTTLLAALRDQGLRPIRSTAHDDRGEDAVIGIGGKRFTVQFITVPPYKSFWNRAARGTSETAIGTESALDWIRQAALTKFQATSPAERPKTVLVLDTHHAGVLASNQISIAYLSRHPDPHSEFGFAATWLIGPDTSSCTQIGTASWTY